MKIKTSIFPKIEKDNFSITIEGGEDIFFFVGSEAERDMLKRMAESIISHYEQRLKLK